jgi:RecA/RadA recombinase
MTNNDFLKGIIREVGNEYASMVSDGVDAGDVDSFIDTGSHILNALLSGSIYGGLASNKITALAGESATGKTFFLMGIVKNFLDTNPNAGVIYFESESAITKQMVVDRGIDPDRMVMMPVTTVQEFRTQSLKVLDSYLAQANSDRHPLFLCLDSLGMLSTTKEVEDTADGKETRDMTRAQVLKAAFRVLTLKLGRAKVPMVVTNHTYDVVGSMFPQKEMGGGSGLKYAASSIIYLSKKKEKDGTEVIGNIIHCKNHKSRLTKENKMVDVRLTYDKGLDKYYGLLELAEKYNIFKKVSTRFELPDGSKQFGKTILNDPLTYFTDDIMKQLDDAASKEFKYASGD